MPIGTADALWGGVQVAVTSHKGAFEESRVPTFLLESELDLFVLFFPCRLVRDA